MKINISVIGVFLLGLVFMSCAREPMDIGEYDWKVKSLSGSSADSQKLAVLTLEFGEEQKVTGNAGCNEFRGGATYNEEQIKFSTLYTDRKICDDYDLEKRFLQNLELSANYTSQGNKLALLDDSGNILVELEKM